MLRCLGAPLGCALSAVPPNGIAARYGAHGAEHCTRHSVWAIIGGLARVRNCAALDVSHLPQGLGYVQSVARLCSHSHLRNNPRLGWRNTSHPIPWPGWIQTQPIVMWWGAWWDRLPCMSGAHVCHTHRGPSVSTYLSANSSGVSARHSWNTSVAYDPRTGSRASANALSLPFACARCAACLCVAVALIPFRSSVASCGTVAGTSSW